MEACSAQLLAFSSICANCTPTSLSHSNGSKLSTPTWCVYRYMVSHMVAAPVMSWHSCSRRAICRCTAAFLFFHLRPHRCTMGARPTRRHMSWFSCSGLTACRCTTNDTELHFGQSSTRYLALFSERYSSNTRPTHRYTMADALQLREETLAIRLRCVSSPPTPPGGQRFAFASGFATHPHARACCETSPATGPLLHRSSLCMFCADTRALPMLALCQISFAVSPGSESQSLQRHPALL